MARKLPRGIDFTKEQMYRTRVSWRGKQHSIGHFFTLGDAQAALDIARSEMARGLFIPPQQRRQEIRDAEVAERLNAVTVSEWAADWLERLESLGRHSPGTTRSYQSTLNVHILPVLGQRRLVDVTSSDVDRFMDGVRRKGGPWTNVARTIRALFSAAVAAEGTGLTSSPVRISIPKQSSTSHEPLDAEQLATPTEVRALAEAMPQHLRIVIPLAAWCALRKGEILGLQRRALEHLDDADRATLHVSRQWHSKTTPPGYAPPKRGSARRLAIPPVLLGPLREHIDTHAAPGREGPLLPSPRNPAVPISETTLDRVWREARDAVGLPRLKLHDLRHTGLTAYARQGATLEEIMRRGGHQDIEAARRYQHATLERDRHLVKGLGTDTG